MRQREWEAAVADLKMLGDDDVADERRSLALAESEVAESEQKLRVLQAGSRPEEIEATRAEVARLEAQQSFIEEQIRLTTVTSPITGVVTTPERQLEEMPGLYIGKGDLIAEVYDLHVVTVEIGVSEKEIEDVRVGAKVGVKARAYPDRLFTGTVTAIATTADASLANNAPPTTARAREQPANTRTRLGTTEIP